MDIIFLNGSTLYFTHRGSIQILRGHANVVKRFNLTSIVITAIQHTTFNHHHLEIPGASTVPTEDLHRNERSSLGIILCGTNKQLRSQMRSLTVITARTAVLAVVIGNYRVVQTGPY